MSCNESCNQNTNTPSRSNRGGLGAIVIIVLYILLAIILGSCIY